MEKSYILKYNETKGDYVIVEAQQNLRQKRNIFEGFNGIFRKKEQNQLNQGLKVLDNEMQTNSPQNEQTPPQTNVTPTPQNSLSVADSLPLIASLYAKFRILNMFYQNLRSINSNFANIFNDYVAINTALQGSLLNIFNSLSNNARLPQSNESLPSLPSDAQGILKMVADQIQQMREINYQLLNLFEVEDINRELMMIETALSIQASQVTNLRLDG